MTGPKRDVICVTRCMNRSVYQLHSCYFHLNTAIMRNSRCSQYWPTLDYLDGWPLRWIYLGIGKVGLITEMNMIYLCSNNKLSCNIQITCMYSSNFPRFNLPRVCATPNSRLWCVSWNINVLGDVWIAVLNCNLIFFKTITTFTVIRNLYLIERIFNEWH